MAKRYGKSMMQLQGFDDFLEKIEEAGAAMETEGRKCFEGCAENLYDELYAKAAAAGLDNRLLEQINEDFTESFKHNMWRYEVGWSKQHPSKPGKPLPDTYKVLFFNYGTAKRSTAKGYNRGAESSHPAGSHGFIKKAKLAALNRNKRLQREALDKILGGLKK